VVVEIIEPFKAIKPEYHPKIF